MGLPSLIGMGGGATGLSQSAGPAALDPYASGGVVSETADPGSSTGFYRYHTFIIQGAYDTFQVLPDTPANINCDVLVIGGGAGGGAYTGAGGGAGGMAIVSDYTCPIGTPFKATVGACGSGNANNSQRGGTGSQSNFSPRVSPGPTNQVVGEGGGGGASGGGGGAGGDGGCGGGGSYPTMPSGPGSTDQPSLNSWVPAPTITQYGNNGGTGVGPGQGGGGGTGAVGGNASPDNGGPGGTGTALTWIYGPTQPVYYCGGGAGGQNGPPTSTGGSNIGGYSRGPADSDTDTNSHYSSGLDTTGSGGGGCDNDPTAPLKEGRGGRGGGGLISVRYEIPAMSGTAKATGGAISFYDGKAIHAFFRPGNFTTPASFSETCEYVCIGGGGAGGTSGGNGGGGGAGGYFTGTTPIGSSQTCAVHIGQGGCSNVETPTQTLSGSAVSAGAQGQATTFGVPAGTITAGGGGWGGNSNPPIPPGNPGNNGGGGGGGGAAGAPGGEGTGANFPGTIGVTPPAGWGHDGGSGGPTGSDTAGGGGGGAGGAGGNGGNPTQPYGGDGGYAIQLPTTFRDPISGVGCPGPTDTSNDNPGWSGVDDSGKYWVAGGGGGAGVGPWGAQSGEGGGGATGGPEPFGPVGYGGGGPGGENGKNGAPGTGGGGGGAKGQGGPTAGGDGGSGLVLVAYPT